MNHKTFIPLHLQGQFPRQFRAFPKVFALTVALAWPATAPAQSGAADPLPLPLDEVRMFTQALDRIRLAYVEEIDDRTLLELAIKGMLSGLDPHSAYLAGNDYDVLQETTTGEFGGLGIEVGREDGFIKVISPIDDTPADRAGIRAGDLIIQINNIPLRQMLPEEAAQMMRGEPGSRVTVTIARDGMEPFDLAIVREVIAINSTRSMMLEPGYAYLRIAQFRLNTGADLEQEIAQLRQEHGELKGLVLDLRNNPGGVLQSSVQVVDSFIGQGRIVYTQGRLEGNDLEFFATSNTIAPQVPMVVLINNGSASASEIVAGALQDHGRAIIMGTQSFGKGSVQSVFPLDETRAIKLTTSLYFTPNGRSIQAQGISPDIEVDDAFVTRRSRNFRQFNEADLPGRLDNGNGGQSAESGAGQGGRQSNGQNNGQGNAQSSGQTGGQSRGRTRGQSGEQIVNSNEEMAAALISAEEVLVSDYPLNEALNVLKGINVLRNL